MCEGGKSSDDSILALFMVLFNGLQDVSGRFASNVTPSDGFPSRRTFRLLCYILANSVSHTLLTTQSFSSGTSSTAFP